jgi:hypothetical protein
MDESGFDIGTSQKNRVIAYSAQSIHWKAVPGRQVWVLFVGCTSAAGMSLPPLIIFKAEQLRRTWITKDTPNYWRFSASFKGWTSNIHGLDWLRTIFDPVTWEGVGNNSHP